MLRAILIDCIPPSISSEEAHYRLEEAESLIKTFGGVVLVKKIQKKLVPHYDTYIGSGKLQEIMGENHQLDANILIINNELKPRQTYNIGELFRKNKAKLQVWDRIDLILKIFQQHAHTKEAKLEIELASIKHMGPRIFGMGMELSRQGGGIGTKGVGETNLEFMRRHLAAIEQGIKKDLEACKKVRKLHRASRRRKELKTVGIIGYTNAGKTSLLNALTHKGAYAADKLFATLDTRVGKLILNNSANNNGSNNNSIHNNYSNDNGSTNNHNSAGDNEMANGNGLNNNFGSNNNGGSINGNGSNGFKEVLVSDTIGFIQNLPPTLIKSFQSTLEETVEADLLLHVIDGNDVRIKEKIKTVQEILGQIDAFHKPTLYVFNKIDCLSAEQRQALEEEFADYNPLLVSTVSKEGLDGLKDTIQMSLEL